MEGQAGLDNTGPAPDGRQAASPDAGASGQNAAGQDAAGQNAGGTDAAAQDTGGLGATGRCGPARDGRGRHGPGRHGAEFSDADPPHPIEMPDLSKLAQDWITLWQSELSAMAADPEIHESWQTMIALWAGTMAAMLRGLPRDTRASRRERARSGSADAAGAAPAAPAPDARDAEIERLARHVTALERRLAELERGGNPAVNPKSRPGRKQRR